MRTFIISPMHSAAALLSRRPHQPPPSVTLGHPDIALALGRVHELCGSARRTLALALAARAGSPVIWIGTNKVAETLNADGIADLMPPGALVFVQGERSTTALWAMEEALRSGTAPVVIADLQTPPTMTPVRRLHLAAETGCGVGRCRPLALLLTPDVGGAPGIETRWALHPAHRPSIQRWTLDQLRARMAPPRDWLMELTAQGLTPCAIASRAQG